MVASIFTPPPPPSSGDQLLRRLLCKKTISLNKENVIYIRLSVKMNHANPSCIHILIYKLAIETIIIDSGFVRYATGRDCMDIVEKNLLT